MEISISCGGMQCKGDGLAPFGKPSLQAQSRQMLKCLQERIGHTLCKICLAVISSMARCCPQDCYGSLYTLLNFLLSDYSAHLAAPRTQSLVISKLALI